MKALKFSFAYRILESYEDATQVPGYQSLLDLGWRDTTTQSSAVDKIIQLRKNSQVLIFSSDGQVTLDGSQIYSNADGINTYREWSDAYSAVLRKVSISGPETSSSISKLPGTSSIPNPAISPNPKLLPIGIRREKTNLNQSLKMKLEKSGWKMETNPARRGNFLVVLINSQVGLGIAISKDFQVLKMFLDDFSTVPISFPKYNDLQSILGVLERKLLPGPSSRVKDWAKIMKGESGYLEARKPQPQDDWTFADIHAEVLKTPEHQELISLGFKDTTSRVQIKNGNSRWSHPSLNWDLMLMGYGWIRRYYHDNSTPAIGRTNIFNLKTQEGVDYGMQNLLSYVKKNFLINGEIREKNSRAKPINPPWLRRGK